MKLYKDIYLSESLSGQRYELTWKLKHNLKIQKLYVIVLPDTASDSLLEIYDYNELRKKKDYKELTAVAAAADKGEAIELVRFMIEEVYQQTGGLDLRNKFG